MTYWTIENVGVSGGSEKTIAAWGVDDVTAVFVSQAEDTVTLSANGRKMDAAYLFPYKSTVTIRRDRVKATDGSFSGGSVYFTGLVAHPHVGASGRREFQMCSLVGPWWYLNERGFEQEYREVVSITSGVPTYRSPNPTRSRVFLNLQLGTYGQLTVEKLTTGEQLTEILNWVLKPFVDTSTTPPFQIGTIGLAVDAPVDEVKNITCAEAARKMFRWSPDCVTWFDYSTTPPTFHVQRRAALTTFNLNLTTQKPTSIAVRPRFDLQRPYVKIQYEFTDSLNGVTLQRTEEEVYPDPPPTGALNQFAGVPFVIDLRGYTRSTTPGVAIQTTLIDTASSTWWLTHAASYRAALDAGRIALITFDFASAELAAAVTGEELASLARSLVRGQPSDAINATWQQQKATIKADIVWANGKRDPDHTIAFNFTATNATSGTYGGSSTVDEGDPQPVGLAQDFYNAVAHVPYEGSLSFREAELGGLPKLGNKLNLLGSANSDWATMATLVQRVTENVQRRTTTIEFGTPPHLDLGDLVALLRVARHRDPNNPYSIRVGGSGSGGAGSGSTLRDVSTVQNSISAGGNHAVVVASGSPNPDDEEDDAKKGVIKLDGPGKQILMFAADDEAEMELRVADLPGTGSVKFRETKGVNAAGEPVYAYIARTASYATRVEAEEPDFQGGGGTGDSPWRVYRSDPAALKFQLTRGYVITDGDVFSPINYSTEFTLSPSSTYWAYVVIDGIDTTIHFSTTRPAWALDTIAIAKIVTPASGGGADTITQILAENIQIPCL
jgi:hypothetical protein